MAATIVPILATSDYSEQTAAAGRILREGGIAVLPTDTMYGAAGLLTSAAARTRLRGLRPSLEVRPLTIHLARRADARLYLGDIPPLAEQLMRKLWPGPVGLTFDVPAARRAEIAASLGLPEEELFFEGTITLRCPDQPMALDVLAAANADGGGHGAGPVVLTQAPTATGELAQRAADVDPAIRDAADIVLDAGPTRYSKPSTLVRIRADGRYELTRAGVYDARTIERMMKTTILFVCSGNTCRSPMAMALARKVLAEKLGTTADGLEAKGTSVLSAGAFAMAGSRATPQAVEAVKDLGADLSAHRSRPLTAELVNSADLIFAMGRSHRSAVLSLAPAAAEKVHTLDPAGDIDDPIGSDVSVYRSLAGSLEKLIRTRLEEKLGSNAGKTGGQP
jgi:protein-tyrosine-phosphatase/tRNA A37 threonylcarbamoyladenosine synthetase subunit TsaC/SUA5/YrdC